MEENFNLAFGQENQSPARKRDEKRRFKDSEIEYKLESNSDGKVSSAVNLDNDDKSKQPLRFSEEQKQSCKAAAKYCYDKYLDHSMMRLPKGTLKKIFEMRIENDECLASIPYDKFVRWV